MERTAAGPTPYFFVASFGGLHELRMIRQPEIVVRAEVEHVFSIDDQARALRRADRADAVVQALLLQPVNFLRQPIEFGHLLWPPWSVHHPHFIIAAFLGAGIILSKPASSEPWTFVASSRVRMSRSPPDR